MEERIDSENVQQIDLISMLKDIGREWITILLLSIAAALFADIWICATYQPEYKTSTTFVVTAKGMNSNIYQNLTSTKDLAQQFTEILGSNVLKKKVAQDIGVNSLDVETSVDLVPETNLITLSVKAKPRQNPIVYSGQLWKITTQFRIMPSKMSSSKPFSSLQLRCHRPIH